MPWFITAICDDETTKKVAERTPKNITVPNRFRCFGFFNTYNEAYKVVNENQGSMRECLYDYIVMEYIEPGIHPTVRATQWWVWDDQKNEWKFLPEGETPLEFRGFVNWALG